MTKQHSSLPDISQGRFFFVRGFMRSGTNWVGNLLNLHPKISCTGEFYFDELYAALKKNIRIGYGLLSNPQIRTHAEKGLENLVKSCIVAGNNLLKKDGLIWYGDRTPRDIEPVLVNNCSYFLVIRDPRDVVVSWAYHLLRIKLSGQPDDPHKIHFDHHPEFYKKRKIFKQNQEHFKKNPHELFTDMEPWVRAIAKKWNIRMNLNLNSIEKIKKGLLNTSVLVVKYEKLHEDLINERIKMYRFLGLNPDEADPVNELTMPGFKKERFNSHYRKGIVGDWNQYFTPEISRWFHEEAQNMMLQFGYNHS